jgi:hypothetical protein
MPSAEGATESVSVCGRFGLQTCGHSVFAPDSNAPSALPAFLNAFLGLENSSGSRRTKFFPGASDFAPSPPLATSDSRASIRLTLSFFCVPCVLLVCSSPPLLGRVRVHSRSGFSDRILKHDDFECTKVRVHTLVFIPLSFGSRCPPEFVL